VTTLLLVRHGLTALTGSQLVGRTPGVGLDARGQGQADAVAQRLQPLPLAAVVSSPLDRCAQTAATIAAGRELEVQHDDRFLEVGYGDWTMKPYKELYKDPLWKVVQQHPAAMVFPGEGGEALAHVQTRAVAGVREWNAKLGPDATWLVCSHGDVIAALLADALGMHLDLFQRIMVAPCSVSVVSYDETRTSVLRMNDTGGDVTSLLPPPPKRRRKPAPRTLDA
jgi:probable phosphomutase (TIGR03848 family)